MINAISEPFRNEGGEFFVTASIGISLYPRDGTEYEPLMKKAEAAMYVAKQGGRSRYDFYRPPV
jgi:GGDEF domain-containing protein